MTEPSGTFRFVAHLGHGAIGTGGSLGWGNESPADDRACDTLTHDGTRSVRVCDPQTEKPMT